MVDLPEPLGAQRMIIIKVLLNYNSGYKGTTKNAQMQEKKKKLYFLLII